MTRRCASALGSSRASSAAAFAYRAAPAAPNRDSATAIVEIAAAAESVGGFEKADYLFRAAVSLVPKPASPAARQTRCFHKDLAYAPQLPNCRERR